MSGDFAMSFVPAGTTTLFRPLTCVALPEKHTAGAERLESMLLPA